MRYPVVLDLETKHTFRDFSDHKKLGISVVGLYNYKDDTLKAYMEDEISDLCRVLEDASHIIGYNINTFDLPVLQAYYFGNISQFKTFDLLDDIRLIIGRRLALNDLVKATLEKGKSGHGLHAIDLYKEGKWEELKSYCIDDVALTKELFEYGVKHGEVYYLDVAGKTTIRVNWAKYTREQKSEDVSLTLPF
jgi:DEAD/DEAH box helicase domain-containing protein